MRSSTSFIATTAALVATSLAHAQTADPGDFPAQRLRPSLDREGIIDVEWGAIPEDRSVELNLWLGYANDPVVLGRRRADGTTQRVGALVGDVLDAHLGLTVVLARWLELGAMGRVSLWQDRPDRLAIGTGGALAPLTGFDFADVRLAAKFGLLRAETQGVDLALLLGGTLPTGRSASYLGDSGPALVPELVLSRRIGALRLAADLSVLLREQTQALNLVVDDELQYRFGAGWRFDADGPAPLELDLALSGATALSGPFSAANQSPLELLAMARWFPTPVLVAGIGGGIGLLEGFGSPDFRLFAMIGWADVVRDADGDGIADDRDVCPTRPEDFDDFADEDGCPDEDDDEDGIPDVSDGAPRDPEDFDGFEDTDGIPDRDNDGDLVPDVTDRCPTRPGPVDNAGCPTADSDGDGLLDHQDRCPAAAEDFDRFEDEDGCPEPDNDGDGVADREDACPLVAGPAENKGCPDSDRDGDGVVDRRDNCPDEPGPAANQGCVKRQLVVIEAGRLEIRDRVYFKSGSADLASRSFGLLRNVADVMKAHPEIGRFRIEGHTDDRGRDDMNKKLSQRRAESVRAFLVAQGVEVARLDAVGFGEERPIDSNATAEGRQNNRRVEFNIVVETPAAPERSLPAPP